MHQETQGSGLIAQSVQHCFPLRHRPWVVPLALAPRFFDRLSRLKRDNPITSALQGRQHLVRGFFGAVGQIVFFSEEVADDATGAQKGSLSESSFRCRK